MNVKYTRLFTADNGISTFEDVTLELVPGEFGCPPAEAVHLADFGAATSISFSGTTPLWAEPSHPAPRRMLVICLQGVMEVSTDETTHQYKAGEMLLVEDVGSLGHSARCIEPYLAALVYLPD